MRYRCGCRPLVEVKRHKMSFGEAGHTCHCSRGRFSPFVTHCPQVCGSRWFLRAKCLISPRSWVEGIYKNGERKRLKMDLWDGVFLHPCFLGAGVSQRQQVSLWAHLPFSLTPVLSSPGCDLLPEEPRHTWASFEQGHNCHCLQQVCSLLSVFTQGNGDSTYCAAAYRMQVTEGNEWNRCFPSSPGIMRGWQRWAPNLRWRNSRRDLYSALSAAGQSWSPLRLEISILLQTSMQILFQEQT